METLRKIQFFVKGRFNYLSNGDKPPIPADLSGKRVLITGASSGLGQAAALQYAKLNAQVILVCRNQTKAKQSVQKIKKISQNQQVSYRLCDLSLLKQINRFCQKHSQKDWLDVIVLNAGVMINTRQLTKQGVQSNYATNVLGTYLMIEELRNSLRKDGKMIIVSSGGMLTQPLILQDLQMKNCTFDGTKQYAINKRQQIALTQHYANKYQQFGFYSMHPGWADTPGVKTSMPDFYNSFKDKLKTDMEGADTITWLGCQSIKNLKSGAFYYERQQANKHLTLGGTKYQPKQVDQLIKLIQARIQQVLK